jgi:hypothetical protein
MEHTKNVLGRMKAMANLSLSMAESTAIPVAAGRALWTGCVLPSVLYGIDVTALNATDLEKMEVIQTSFGANLVGVGRKGAPKVGVRSELGLSTLRRRVDKAKLQWWARACHLPAETWTKQALIACLSAHGGEPDAAGAVPRSGIPVIWSAEPESEHTGLEARGHKWTSSYAKEIAEIIHRLKVDKITGIGLFNQPELLRAVTRTVVKAHEGLWETEMEEKRQHSLRALTNYGAKETRGCQEYLMYGGPHYSTMAKFRMADADLGNRRRKEDNCPACKKPPNIEGHLLFQCEAVSGLRDETRESVGLQTFLKSKGVNVQTADKDALSALLKAFLTGTAAQANETRSPGEIVKHRRDELRRRRISSTPCGNSGKTS